MFKIIPHAFDKIEYGMFNSHEMGKILFFIIIFSIILNFIITLFALLPSGYTFFEMVQNFFLGTIVTTIIIFFLIAISTASTVEKNQAISDGGMFGEATIAKDIKSINQNDIYKINAKHDLRELDKLIRTSIGYVQKAYEENDNEATKKVKFITHSQVPDDKVLKENQMQYAQLIYLPEEKPVEVYLYQITYEKEEPTKLLEKFFNSIFNQTKRIEEKYKVKLDKETIQKNADEKIHFYYDETQDMIFLYE